jgi:hypothetical protein
MPRWLRCLLVAALAAAAGYLLARGTAAGRTGGETALAPVDEPAPAAAQPGADAGAVLRAGPLPPLPPTLLDSTSVDVDADGAAERIELYTAAERDRAGRVMWDDGQRWLLVVRDGEAAYPLFDGYVQLGHLAFWVVEGVAGPPTVVVQEQTGAGIRTHGLVHDPAAGGFVRTQALEVTGNVVHASSPAF